jgi:hypothetical protein
MDDNYMVGVSIIILFIGIALLFLLTNYQIITGTDEIKELIIKFNQTIYSTKDDG